MKNFLFALLFLGSACAYAGPMSKHELETLKKKNAQVKVNGQDFDVDDVVGMFKSFAKEGDDGWRKEDEYQLRRRDYLRKYGNGEKAKLLFQLALAQYYIKRFEKDMDYDFNDHDLIDIPNTFIGDGRRSWPSEDSCFVKYRPGRQTTHCTIDPGSSGVGMTLLFMATMGRMGGTGYSRGPSTSCQATQNLHTIVKTKVNGVDVFSLHDLEARGESYRSGKKIIKRPLRVEARKECDAQLYDIEDNVILKSCED